MTTRTKPLDPQNLVVVGRVRRPWGVKGAVTVDWVDRHSPMKEGSSIYLQQGDEGPVKELRIVRNDRHGRSYIVSLKGVTTPEEAIPYRGSKIWIEKKDLPALQKNEYYAYELVGMRVMSSQGEYLGEITNIFSTGSNDVYVVCKEGGEILVPATHDVIKNIDCRGKVMVVEVIEGLLGP